MFDAEKLLAGDEEALGDAVDTLSPKLIGYAAGILLSEADAADAVQTAFVRLWRHRASVREAAALEAYLYRCTYHACLDIIRRRRFFTDPPRPHEIRRGFSEETRRVLGTLSPINRAILYGRAVEEMSYAELAQRYHISESTARKRYERARRKAAELLKKEKNHD